MNYAQDDNLKELIKNSIESKKNSWYHFKAQVMYFETHRPDDSRLPESKRRLQQLETDLAVLKEEYPEFFL